MHVAAPTHNPSGALAEMKTTVTVSRHLTHSKGWSAYTLLAVGSASTRLAPIIPEHQRKRYTSTSVIMMMTVKIRERR